MSIFNFTKKLLPRIDRGQVLEDLRMTEKELSTIILPCWETAGIHFNVTKPGSKPVLGLNQRFVYNYNYRGRAKAANFIQDIVRGLPLVVALAKELREVVEKELERDILSAAITARKATVLRTVTNLSWLCRYLPNLLNYIYLEEARAIEKSLDPELEISKGDCEFVLANFERFVRVFGEYVLAPKDFKGLIAQTPEVLLSPEGQDAVMGLYTEKDVDPIGGPGVSGFVGDVIYRLRLPIAKWQNDRYEAAKARKQQLELRLLYLEQQAKKENDPVIIADISRLQERIEGYERYIREVEADLEEDR